MRVCHSLRKKANSTIRWVNLVCTDKPSTVWPILLRFSRSFSLAALFRKYLSFIIPFRLADFAMRPNDRKQNRSTQTCRSFTPILGTQYYRQKTKQKNQRTNKWFHPRRRWSMIPDSPKPLWRPPHHFARWGGVVMSLARKGGIIGTKPENSTTAKLNNTKIEFILTTGWPRHNNTLFLAPRPHFIVHIHPTKKAWPPKSFYPRTR